MTSTATAPTTSFHLAERLAFAHFGRAAFAASVVYLAAVAFPMAASSRFGGNIGVWPATAVGITTMFLTPRAFRPLMMVALATMHWMAMELFLTSSVPLQLLLLAARGVGEWGTVEVAERAFKRLPDFEHAPDLARFALLAALVTLPTASLFSGIGYFAVGRGTILAEALQWWISEVTWVLLLVPALMYLRRRQVDTQRSTTRTLMLERVLFFEVITLLLAVFVVFYRDSALSRLPIGIFITPLLLWSAFRLGVGTTLWGSIIVAVGTVGSTISGEGLFAASFTDPFTQLAWAQCYAFVIGLSHILLALAVQQHRADERERVRILEVVRMSSARLEAYVAGTRDAMAVVDVQGALVASSPAAASLVGKLRREGTSWQRALEGETFTATMLLDDAAKANPGDHTSGEPTEGEYAVTLLPLRDANAAIIGASASAVNLTDLRSEIAAEERSQRLATVGRLAGGIAHDFNNIMMIILGNLTLLKESIPSHDRKRVDVDEASDAAQRAVGLTRQLLAYARRQSVEPQQVRLGGHVRQMATMLKRLVGADIQLTVDEQSSDSTVWIDPSQLDQVVVNLVVNARDAMASGGVLRLVVDQTLIDDARAAELGMPAGDAITLAVADQGHGIAPEALPHVFEPFFSTKPTGKGTGLGLATVDGIVRQAGGAINVVSVVSQGATFTIYLPQVSLPRVS